MQVKLWGVRGSLASGGEGFMRHGANTSCYAIEVEAAPYILLDAGSGIRNFGTSVLDAPKMKKCALFLSHSHWDHVSGLPFFACLYKKDWEVDIYAPESIGGMDAESFVKSLFSSSFFPVAWDDLASTKRIIPVKDKETITLEGGVTVTAHESWHGGENIQGLYSAAYRVQSNGHSVFYSGDHELGTEALSVADKQKSFFQGLQGADIAILDSQYTLATYKNHVGWGHSAIEQWIPLIKEFNVKTFVPTHFGPNSDDDYLDMLAHGLLSNDESLSNRMCMAYEGLELRCAATHTSPHAHVASLFDCENCSFSSELMTIPDMSTVLDMLLTKARKLSHADAGTIYLVEDGQLVFSYSHNETLFTSSQSARQQYLNARLPITPNSIAGYVACNRSVLNIANVRELPEGALYSFNDSFDKATGYNTVSICALPIVQDGELLAVMQIINSTYEGKPVPFSFQVERSLRELCIVAAQVIEQALVTVDMLLRVLETTRLRDPLETGPHVLRVGSMAAELYHHWALKHNVDLVDLLSTKAHIRLASMLHDVGKVGISDKVLKKPGRFTPEERAIMEKHSCIGAEIFKGAKRTVDKMAASIALHHHQRWDGKGYTGIEGDCPLAGEDIPVPARITSIVDVFDALVSRRCYKDPMPLDKALGIIKSESGTAFDPEMVECFLEILDTMMAIQSKYQDIIIEPKEDEKW